MTATLVSDDPNCLMVAVDLASSPGLSCTVPFPAGTMLHELTWSSSPDRMRIRAVVAFATIDARDAFLYDLKKWW
jgi:hypothetical protein